MCSTCAPSMFCDCPEFSSFSLCNSNSVVAARVQIWIGAMAILAADIFHLLVGVRSFWIPETLWMVSMGKANTKILLGALSSNERTTWRAAFPKNGCFALNRLLYSSTDCSHSNMAASILMRRVPGTRYPSFSVLFI